MEVTSREIFDKYYQTDGYTSFTLSITTEQAISLDGILNGYVNNPGTYSIFGNQCTSVACISIMNAGINIRDNHIIGDPGPAPISAWLLTPAGFADILQKSVNQGIVTGMQYYGGN